MLCYVSEIYFYRLDNLESNYFDELNHFFNVPVNSFFLIRQGMIGLSIIDPIRRPHEKANTDKIEMLEEDLHIKGIKFRAIRSELRGELDSIKEQRRSSCFDGRWKGPKIRIQTRWIKLNWQLKRHDNAVTYNQHTRCYFCNYEKEDPLPERCNLLSHYRKMTELSQNNLPST